MILGQPVPQSQRVPFDRTRHAAPGYVPRMIKTSFQTHLHPLQHVLPAMTGRMPRLPTSDVIAQMQPGAPRARWGLMQQAVGEMPGASAEPAAAAAVAPGPPVPAATNGFGATMFGITGGGHPRRGGGGVNPYRVMHNGTWPGYIMSNARHIRRGVVGAGNLMKRLHPFQYPGGVPAGTYFRPLAPAAAPAVLAPVPGPTAGYYGW
jgi:hypothetical protein